MLSEPLPPMTIRASRPRSAIVAVDLGDAGRRVERAAPLGAEHRAAARQRAAHRLDRQRHRAPLAHAVPRVEEADELVAVDPLALAHDGPDHGVQPGAVAAAGEDADSHRVERRGPGRGVLSIVAVGWDASRPVPWRRLIKEWADLRRDHGRRVRRVLPRRRNLLPILAGLLVSGPLYLGFGLRAGQVRLPAQDAGRAAHARGRRRRAVPPSGAAATVPSGPAPHRRAAPRAVRTGRRRAGAGDVRHRHRCRHDRHPQPGRVHRRLAERRLVPRVHPALPATRLGRARPRRDLGRGAGDAARRRRAGRRRRPWRRSASPTSARPSWRGTARPGKPYGRAIVWQDRRTAARCDELAAAGALDLVRERTGLVLDPYFSGTKFEWLLGPGGVPVDRRPRPRHGRRLVDLEPHRRRGLRHRRHERQPHDAVRHRPAAVGRGARRAAARADRPPPGRGRVERAGRRHLGSVRRARRHPDQRHRRRPAGGAVRPGLLPPGHGQEHLRHGQLRAAQRRPDVPAAGGGHADDRRLDARRRHAWPTPWRGRSSPPARRSSGCATVSGSSPRPPRSDRWRPRSTTAAVCSSFPPSPGWVRRGGTRTPAARSSGSPVARPVPTSPGPSSSRWRSRPAMPSRRWCAPVAER